MNTVNLGCPGETSATLINATNATTGCTTYNAPALFGGQPLPIHVNHPGKTQLQAAVDVLQSVGKRVSPITIDIGANDVLGAVNGCTSGGVISLSCVQADAPAVFATINSNLDTTLATLRQEGGVKHEIIVLGLYNVLYPAIFQQTLIQTAAPGRGRCRRCGERPARDSAELAAGGDGGEVPRGVRRSVPGVQPAGQPRGGDLVDLHEDGRLCPPMTSTRRMAVTPTSRT